MEPTKLYFDVRDIFRAPKLALSGKKIWIFLKANLFGFAFYWVLTNLALLLNGTNLSESINNYGLYPCIFAIDNSTILSQIIYWIGIIIWIVAIYYACTAVSRITFKQLKGDYYYSIADANKFVKKHRYPIVMSWVSILLIAGFFIVGAMFFALIGKIPYFGEILFALLYLLYFFGAIFTVYTLLVFLVSLIYSPAIVATFKEDTMGTVFQSYSITWSQSWRLVLYHVILLPLLLIAVAILKWFFLAGYKLIDWIFGLTWFMGDKFDRIVGWASDLVGPYCGFSTCVNNFSLPILESGTALNTPEYIAGTIVGLFLFILLLAIVSYGLSVLSVGETIIFTILKYKSTGENLLLRDVEEDNNNKSNQVIDDIKSVYPKNTAD